MQHNFYDTLGIMSTQLADLISPKYHSNPQSA
jgi:hypothetical protein